VDGALIAGAYDGLAPGYDRELEQSGWMRRRLWRHFDRLFQRGDRVLDVGCGTGIDSVHLAARGVRVVAVDASTEMMARLRAKTRSSVGPARPDTHVGEINEVLAGLAGPFDGLVSSFAALNTVALGPFARTAARLLRPGARAVCHLLSPGFHGHWRARARRALGGRRGPEALAVQLGERRIAHLNLAPGEIYRRYFAGAFEDRGCYPLGLLVPTRLERRLPQTILDLAGTLEVAAGALPPARALGRFFVLDLERRR